MCLRQPGTERAGPCSSSRGGGGVVAEEVYFSRELKNKHGGIVKVGNYLYGDFDDREALGARTPEPVKSNGVGMAVDKETDPLA